MNINETPDFFADKRTSSNERAPSRPAPFDQPEKLPLELAVEEAERGHYGYPPVSSESDAEKRAVPNNDQAEENYIRENESEVRPTAEHKLRGNRILPSFLRSTPPQQSAATILPAREEASMDYENHHDPINSSNNEEIAGLARADRASSRAYSQAPRATRSGRAARAAGLDMTEEYRSRGKFRQSLALVRQQHPYIMERPLNIRDEDAAELLDKIRSVPFYQIQDLSLSLNSEEIKRIFHALLLINDQQTYKSIQQIAVHRASWSLYTVGWSTLQRHFPNRWIQQTLELIYNTLESDPSRSEVRPGYMRKALGDLVNLSKSDAGLVVDVVRNLNQAYNVSPDEGLETFLEDYQILPESAFGGAILGEFFKKAELPVLYRKKDILASTLPYMEAYRSAEVVSRIISSRDPISDDKKALYKHIAEIFLHRDSTHPMWSYMSADLQRAYNSWYISSKLDSQTAMYPGKKDFLLTYQEDIIDVAMLSTDLMAIRFERFILIDDRRRGDCCIFYDNDTVRDLLLKGLDEKDLGNPGIPGRDVREAVQSGRLSGVVKLNVTQNYLQYSRQFMNLLLGHSNTRHRENVLRNWFR